MVSLDYHQNRFKYRTSFSNLIRIHYTDACLLFDPHSLLYLIDVRQQLQFFLKTSLCPSPPISVLYPNERDSIQLLIFAIVADLTTFFISGTSSTIAIFLGVSRKKPCVQESRRQRQEPAQLMVLRNSPRAIPLSGYELVRPELTCKESVLLCFHRLLTFENAKAEATQLYVKT